MPIRNKYEHFEYPKRMDLAVLKEQPEGLDMHFFGPKTVWSKGPPLKNWFYCPYCQGWIEGKPHENEINNLDGRRLCGRKGTEFYCIRCAREICFSGMMS